MGDFKKRPCLYPLILLHPPASSCEQLLYPEQISLTPPKDREVQVSSEEVVHDASLVCEPVDPETVFDPLVCEPVDPETVCEPSDPEIVFDPLPANRSTAKTSGMK